MTRGYVCIINKGKAEYVAYLSSDAYLSWYGLKILRAMSDGTDALIKYIEAERKDNIASYGKNDDPCKGFFPGWIRPDKDTKTIDGWQYCEYGYMYDLRTETMKVYNNGKLLFSIKNDTEEISRYLFLFENYGVLNHSLAYNQEKLAYTVPFEKTMKMAAGFSLEQLKERVEEEKKTEHILLDDFHLMAPGHHAGHEAYSKKLRKEGCYEPSLEFILEHDHVYTDYGWKVYLQMPFCRVPVLHGTNKHGYFGSEKKAMDAIREVVNKDDNAEKIFRLAKLFADYGEYHDKGIVSFGNFLNFLDKRWEKEPWYFFNSYCGVNYIKRNGFDELHRMAEKKKAEKIS